MTTRKCVLVASLVSFAALAACGGAADPSLSGGNGGPGGLGGGNGDGGLFGDGGPGGGVTNACATDHAAATEAPSYLVIVMDRSDSMSQNAKWTSCSKALSAFFADPTTTGLSASLTFLPWVPNGQPSTPQTPTFSCSATDYATPQVAMTALPSAAFGSVIQAQTLQYGTPTLASLEGAVTQAKAVSQANAGVKVAIVLATDGLPYGCTGNSVATVAQAAAQANAQGVPTYVIGVGPALPNLDAIAQGGGTQAAFVVPTNNPQATEQAFLSAIKTIKGALGCTYAVPAPPSGQTLDPNKVNVVFTPSGGQPTTLVYSSDCSNADGWHYDNPQSPTKILLCTNACGTAKADVGAKMDIVFGCATSGGVTR